MAASRRQVAAANRIVRNFSGIFFGFPSLSEERSEAASGRETEETPVRKGGKRETVAWSSVGLWADVEWETSCLPLLLCDDGALLHLEGPLDRGGEWHPVQAISALRDSYRKMCKFSWSREGI